MGNLYEDDGVKVSVKGRRITDLGAPIADNDAARKIDLAASALPFTSGEAIALGEAVALDNSGGSPEAFKANAAVGTSVRSNAVGICSLGTGTPGALITVSLTGQATVPTSEWDAAPVAGDVGKRVFISPTTPGNLTLTPPTGSGQAHFPIGVVSEGGATPKIMVDKMAKTIRA